MTLLLKFLAVAVISGVGGFLGTALLCGIFGSLNQFVGIPSGILCGGLTYYFTAKRFNLILA